MLETVREPSPSELAQLALIPSAAPFLNHRTLVILASDQLASFLIFRPIAPDEWEILQVETAHAFRRQGFARTLLEAFLRQNHGSTFLEVRESNTAARRLYGRLGFVEIARRLEYYASPAEDAIVLKICS